MDQVYEVWIEIQANKKLISDSVKFREAMEKCKKAGMTGIILSVKDTSGFVLYKSSLADHYSEFDGEFAADIDYAAECFKIIRELGMKCYAAFDVFAEGNKKNRHSLMKGFREGWQCEVYGLDEGGNAVIQKSTEEKALKTVGSIDDFGEIFVNPGNKEVCSYELSLLKEFAENYKPDGIVLDKAAHMVTVDGERIDLSYKEFELLAYFMENAGIALSREKILNSVWNYDYFGDARTIDTHVKKLRAKMGDKGKYITTVWGMGYKFEVTEE